MVTFLKEVISDSRTGKGSSKRFVFMLAGFALSLSTIILAIAACLGQDVGIAIGAVASSLAAFAGYGYVGGKKAEKGGVDVI